LDTKHDSHAHDRNLFVEHPDNDNWKNFIRGGVEFPVINYKKYNGKEYDHFWSGGFGGIFQDRIYHVQWSTLERWVWMEEGYHPSEPIMIPNPEAITEDDGILLSLVSPFCDKKLMVST
jgi:carotenoid cleavage dioxygenase-like enzyme